MLFKRRNPLNILKRFFFFVWPKSGLNRSGKYLALRIKRLEGSPHAIAAGFATGIAISMFPFFGYHMILALAFSWIIGGSMPAAAIGTFIGNPWTFPIIWMVTLHIGNLMLGVSDINKLISSEILINEVLVIADIFRSLVIEGNTEKFNLALEKIELIPIMAIGSIPLAILSWVLVYFIFRRIILRYQKIRNLKIKKVKNSN